MLEKAYNWITSPQGMFCTLVVDVLLVILLTVNILQQLQNYTKDAWNLRCRIDERTSHNKPHRSIVWLKPRECISPQKRLKTHDDTPDPSLKELEFFPVTRY